MSELKNELSPKNPYYIPKHRYLELKHWCLQYQDWCDELNSINYVGSCDGAKKTTDTPKPTESFAIRTLRLKQKIELVRHCAMATDEALAPYIFKAVTQDYSYNYLQTVMEIPCCRDTYYDRYRKFFYILDKKRH